MGLFKKRTPLIFLVGLILVASFLRLYQIRGWATFLGDEGRDALVVRKMIVDRRPTLLGPSTSVGNLYLGPAYYYMMIPSLWLAGFDPVGPAMMVAVIGVATVWLVWRAGTDWFGERAGRVAAVLYALSQPIIEHTRFSWNPNPMPFFALLAVWSTWQVAQTKKRFWLAIVGVCLGVCLQFHYVSAGLMAVVLAMLLKLKPRVGWRGYLVLGLSFLLAVSPMILFELRHDFLITNGLRIFLTQDNKIGLTPVILAQRMGAGVWRLLAHFLASDKSWLAGLVLVGIFGWTLRWRAKRVAVENGWILLVWLLVGLAVAGLYSGDLHDHYIGFLFPVPFLLLGAWFEKKRLLGRLVYWLLIIFMVLNLDLAAGRSPNNQIERAQLVGESIAARVEPGERFNLSLISPTMDFRAMNYRYFVELSGAKPEGFEFYSDLDTLFVVIENEDLRPAGVTAWEIDSFGASEMVDEWQFDFGYKVQQLKKEG